MAKQGFLLPSNLCILHHPNGWMIILWVDDILMISSIILVVDAIRSILEEKYQLWDMGDLTDYLDLQIT